LLVQALSRHHGNVVHTDAAFEIGCCALAGHARRSWHGPVTHRAMVHLLHAPVVPWLIPGIEAGSICVPPIDPCSMPMSFIVRVGRGSIGGNGGYHARAWGERAAGEAGAVLGLSKDRVGATLARLTITS